MCLGLRRTGSVCISLRLLVRDMAVGRGSIAQSILISPRGLVDDTAVGLTHIRVPLTPGTAAQMGGSGTPQLQRGGDRLGSTSQTGPACAHGQFSLGTMLSPSLSALWLGVCCGVWAVHVLGCAGGPCDLKNTFLDGWTRQPVNRHRDVFFPRQHAGCASRVRALTQPLPCFRVVQCLSDALIGRSELGG